MPKLKDDQLFDLNNRALKIEQSNSLAHFWQSQAEEYRNVFYKALNSIKAKLVSDIRAELKKKDEEILALQRSIDHIYARFETHDDYIDSILESINKTGKELNETVVELRKVRERMGYAIREKK